MITQIKKGFTLIELLVVIAIISIIAGIVVVNLNDARVKGYDTAIKAATSQMRNQAELWFDSSGSFRYSTSGTAVTACSGSANFFGSASAQNIVSSINVNDHQSVSSSPLCTINASGDAWMFASALRSGGSTAGSTVWWCVDSTGVATSTKSSLTTADTVCR